MKCHLHEKCIFKRDFAKTAAEMATIRTRQFIMGSKKRWSGLMQVQQCCCRFTNASNKAGRELRPVLVWSSGIQVHVILLSRGGLAENLCISCEINERCKNVQVVCSAVSVIQVLAAFTKPVMIEFVELVQYPRKPQRCYHSIAHVVDVLLQR